MKKRVISLQITDELYEKLKTMSESDYMSVSAFIRKLLMQYCKENEKCTGTSTKQQT